MSSQINEGDIVALKSQQKLVMTVGDIAQGVATCYWFTKDKNNDIVMHKEKIHLAALVKKN